MNYKQALKGIPTMKKVKEVRKHLKRITSNYCCDCKQVTDIKQVERGETCLEVCSVCGKEYELPF